MPSARKTELESVIAAGARYGQGYLLARPATPLPPVRWPSEIEPRSRTVRINRLPR